MANPAEKNKFPPSQELVLPEMVFVKGGEFMMGDDDSEHEEEKPAHKVKVKDFYLSKYPITNRQYANFLNAYGAYEVLEGEYKGAQMIDFYKGIKKQGDIWYIKKDREDYPILHVSWYGAVVYCNWLTQKTGLNYRLVSEAEWEYAAKGGNKSQGYHYAGSNQLKEVGWFWNNSHEELKKLGLKLPNELGLYDMSGNVWEWCQDMWQRDYKKSTNNSLAWEEGTNKSQRVTRGGCWHGLGEFCSVLTRSYGQADEGKFDIGFRVVRNGVLVE